jgi:WD40 repeat protein/serine/threonine protein kinase
MSQPQQQEELVFDAALRMLPHERAEYLDRACKGNPELRRRAEALLGAWERASGFMNEPALSALPAGLPSSLTIEKVGDRIGRYKLLEQIGEGGCGLVYVAEQEEPVRRHVAVKVIKLGMDTKQVVARFDAERQALAIMDHPNIARVLDAGATQTGRPFFVMELVRGIKITDYCDQNNVSTRERLELFVQVCRAIQHAHQKGIIHRDIKPSNILVTVNDGVPLPKVIDFGIAKATQGRLTDQTLFTAFEQFIGTPAYMSPEQAVMTSMDIDTRSDIYSLGVLLYELLTGRTPFDAQELLVVGLDEMRRTIREVEPLKPSTRLTQEFMADGRGRVTPDVSASEANRPRSRDHGVTRACSQRSPEQLKDLIQAMRGDLDWIVMKCLEKDRARRYETANGLGTDIQRHLNNEPVIARPPSRGYRLRKVVRRNRAAFSTAAAIVFALLAGVVVSTSQAVRAKRAEQDQKNLRKQAEAARDASLKQEQLAIRQGKEASEQELLARRRFYAAQMNLANQAAEAGDMARCLDLLETQRPGPGQEDLRGFEWYHIWGLCNVQLLKTIKGGTAPVRQLVFAPDGKTLGSLDWDGIARLWDISAASEKSGLKLTSGYWVFMPDGRTLLLHQKMHFAALFDPASGSIAVQLAGPQNPIRNAAVSPDGKLLATGGNDGVVKFFDMATGREETNFAAGTLPITRLSFSPDGTMLAGASGWLPGSERRLWLWDVTQRPFRVRLQLPTAPTFAFSPDSKTLASSFWDNIDLWDTATGRRRSNMTGHHPRITAIVYLSNGSLVSCSEDRTIRLWRILPTTNCCGRVCLSSGRNEADGTVTVQYKTAGGPMIFEKKVSIHLGWNNWESVVEPDPSMTFDPESQSWNFTAGIPTNATQLDCVFNNGSGFWDNNNEADWHFLRVTNSPPSTGVATGRITWVAPIGEAQTRVLGQHLDGVRALALSPDAKLLVSGGSDGSIKMWDPARHWDEAPRRIAGKFQIGAARWYRDFWSLWFARDGKTLYGVMANATVPMNIETGEVYPEIPGAGDHGVLSPNGNWLATAGEDGYAKLWEVSTSRLAAKVKVFECPVAGIAFSPDNRLLAASAWNDNHVKVFDVRYNLHPVWVNSGSNGAITLVFSPDGKRLAVARRGEGTVFMDVATGKEERTLQTTGPAEIWTLAFTRDGKSVATGGDSGVVSFWDVETGKLRFTLAGHTAVIRSIVFSEDGNTIATGSDDGSVRLWDGSTGQERMRFTDVRDFKSVAFSPDGLTLAAGNAIGTVRFWRAPRTEEAIGVPAPGVSLVK